MTPGQWTLWGACVATEVAALGLAAVVARRARPHLPVVLILAFALVADVALRLNQVYVLEPAARPRALSEPLAYRVDVALVTAWPSAVCALAWWAFSRRAVAVGIAVAWAAANVAIWQLVPPLRDPMATALHRVELAAVAFAALAIMLGWSRRRERSATIALFLAATELVIATVGPFAKGDPYRDWYVATAVYAAGFAVVAAVHAYWLRRPA